MKSRSNRTRGKAANANANDALDVALEAKKNASNGTPDEQDEDMLLSAFEIRERQRRQEEQQNGNAEKLHDASQSPHANKKDKRAFNKQASPAIHITNEDNDIIDQSSPTLKKVTKNSKKQNEAPQSKQQSVNENSDIPAAENINPAHDGDTVVREKSKRQQKKRKLSIDTAEVANAALVGQERSVTAPIKKANKGAAAIEQQSTSDGKKSQSSPNRALAPKPHVPTGSERHCFVVVTKSDNHPLDFSAFPLSKSDDSLKNGRAALDWILQPFGVDRFFEQVWEKHALVLSRSNAKYHNSLFSTADLSELIRTGDLEYGKNINIAQYQNGVRTTLNGQGRVHLKDVQRLIADGCSVQLINPQAFSDSIWYLCELLQEVFGSFVGANTYLTPAGSAGFAPHWDEIDAFLLQLEGRKYWRLYAPENREESFPRESSGNFTPEQMAGRRPVFEGWLEEGDMMHIPRGYIHMANTDPDHHSLHVTVSVCRRVSFADLLDKLVPDLLDVVAEEHAELRHSLPVNGLNFAGVADAEVNKEKYKAERKMFENNLRSMMTMVTNHVVNLADAGYDMMAREFFKTALPPKLTDEEQKLSAVGGRGDTLLKGKPSRVERGSLVRFIRRHGQRLIMESEDRCFIVHRMQNSRVYEGKEEQVIEIPVDLADGFAHLVDQYPAWSKVVDLPCASNDAKIQLASILFSTGLLLMR